MASELYKDYLIISRPTKKYGAASGWVPQVTILWKIQDQQHWHTIEPGIAFLDEGSAESDGLRLGRAWVEQKF